MKKLIYFIPLLAIFFLGCKKEDVQFYIVGTTWKGTFYQWPTTLTFCADNIVKVEIENHQEIGSYTISYIEDLYYPHVTFNITTTYGGIDIEGDLVDYYIFRGDMQVVKDKNEYFLDGTYAISAYYAKYSMVIRDAGYYRTYPSNFKLVK